MAQGHGIIAGVEKLLRSSEREGTMAQGHGIIAGVEKLLRSGEREGPWRKAMASLRE